MYHDPAKSQIIAPVSKVLVVFLSNEKVRTRDKFDIYMHQFHIYKLTTCTRNTTIHKCSQDLHIPRVNIGHLPHSIFAQQKVVPMVKGSSRS